MNPTVSVNILRGLDFGGYDLLRYKSSAMWTTPRQSPFGGESVETARGASVVNKDWTNLQVEYDNLGTYEAVAKAHQCSVHAVQNAMKRMGVKPRPQGLPKGYVWTEERRRNHRAAIDRPEWRAKNRENLLRRLPTMSGPCANSPLEKLIQGALNRAGLSYSTQERLLDKYCVDFLITQSPVIIEADGSLHLLRKQEDAKRDSELTIAGYRVFRFTGREINRDADACVASIVEACRLQPERDPVAVIRTGMVGSNNPSWRGGDKEFTCDNCGASFLKRASHRKYVKKFCNAECYGQWMHKHPETSPVLVRWARARQMKIQSELHGDVQS